MGVGSAFGSLIDPEEPTPGLFRVDAIVDGPARVGLADLAHANAPDSVLSRRESFRVVYAKPGRKAESDAYLRAAKDAEGRPAFKVWDEGYVRRLTERWTRNLPLVLNAIVGAMTVIVGFIVVLLNLISFQARHDEFALWLALGHVRRRLAAKLAVEGAAQAGLALALGLALGFGFLAVYDALFLAPKAIFIRYFDVYPIALASALPLLASAAGAIALSVRLRRMDPVAVIQRRNA
jgi:predicted lysophospholipase L1 biosynthesis ABC-type transport system permease subunit